MQPWNIKLSIFKPASRVWTLQLELVGRKSYAVALARKGSYISEIRWDQDWYHDNHDNRDDDDDDKQLFSQKGYSV